LKNIEIKILKNLKNWTFSVGFVSDYSGGELSDLYDYSKRAWTPGKQGPYSLHFLLNILRVPISQSVTLH
jgi:hypothetical protein